MLKTVRQGARWVLAARLPSGAFWQHVASRHCHFTWTLRLMMGEPCHGRGDPIAFLGILAPACLKLSGVI